jgi:hypothetical protein
MKTFYVSRDPVRNPLMERMVAAGREAARLRKDVRTGSVSVRYGKRVLLTARGADLAHLASDDFVEVVDYNPVTDVTFLIGVGEPPDELPIHWIIYARDEVNAAICVFPKRTQRRADGETAEPGVRRAMALLKLLAHAPAAHLEDGTTVAVGATLRQALEALS